MRNLAVSPVRNEPNPGFGARLRALFTIACGRSRQFGADQRGNVFITTAILLPVLIGAAGVAVSYSIGSSTRSDVQNALDAAVLAGVIASEASSPDPVGAANNAFKANLSSWTTGNAPDVSATFSLDSTSTTMSGKATGNVTNPFGALIGGKTMAIGVAAAATAVTTPVCVLGLDTLGSGSFDINGGAVQFNANCAVQANTTSSKGMTQTGNGAVNATKFGVTGGHKTKTYSPTPADGAPAIPDPYASLPFPYYSSCSGKTKLLEINTGTTLSPGTYCGGVHVYASANVTLQPGIYVMVDGPFWTDGSAVVTGDQVTIAFTGKGSTVQVWGNSQMTVTSPTSGTYMNMQFLQDNSSSETHGLWASIGGSGSSAKLSYDGVAYFPTENFWVRGNAVVNANSPSLAIVTSDVSIQGSTIVNVTHDNTRNLSVSSPTTTNGAKLID
jgi:Flp pilus assembly protein TadG